jgi:hypothetical protein
MKKIILSFLIIILSNTIIGQVDYRWLIEKQDGRLGMIDSLGKEVFTDNFNSLDDNYYNGLVYYSIGSVYDDEAFKIIDWGERGFLDQNGKVVFKLDGWGSFSEGLLNFSNEEGFFYLNTKGEKQLDLQNLSMPEGKEISEIFRFSDGLAMIRIENLNFEDTLTGSDIGYAEYVNLYPGNWFYGFIDKFGKWKVEPTLESATSFNDGISIVQKNKRQYFMNTNGSTSSVLDHPYVNDFSEGFAIVHMEKETSYEVYFIDSKGEKLGNTTFEAARPFSNGLASVQLQDKWGFIDTTGQIVIEPQYYIESSFTEDLAPVSQEVDSLNNSYFIEAFIDTAGNIIIPFKKRVDYGNFRNGIAKGRRFIYTEDNRYTGYYELFYIKKNGEKIWSEVVKQ